MFILASTLYNITSIILSMAYCPTQDEDKIHDLIGLTRFIVRLPLQLSHIMPTVSLSLASAPHRQLLIGVLPFVSSIVSSLLCRSQL